MKGRIKSLREKDFFSTKIPHRWKIVSRETLYFADYLSRWQNHRKPAFFKMGFLREVQLFLEIDCYLKRVLFHILNKFSTFSFGKIEVVFVIFAKLDMMFHVKL